MPPISSMTLLPPRPQPTNAAADSSSDSPATDNSFDQALQKAKQHKADAARKPAAKVAPAKVTRGGAHVKPPMATASKPTDGQSSSDENTTDDAAGENAAAADPTTPETDPSAATDGETATEALPTVEAKASTNAVPHGDTGAAEPVATGPHPQDLPATETTAPSAVAKKSKPVAPTTAKTATPQPAPQPPTAIPTQPSSAPSPPTAATTPTDADPAASKTDAPPVAATQTAPAPTTVKTTTKPAKPKAADPTDTGTGDSDATRATPAATTTGPIPPTTPAEPAPAQNPTGGFGTAKVRAAASASKSHETEATVQATAAAAGVPLAAVDGAPDPTADAGDDTPMGVAAVRAETVPTATPTAVPIPQTPQTPATVKVAAPSQPSAAPSDAAFAAANHPKIVAGVQGQLLPNGGTMQIRLDPPDLGPLQLTVRMRDGTMTAEFQTSNPESTRLLSHSLGELKTSLEAAGITVDKIHVQQAPRDESTGNNAGGEGRGNGSASNQTAHEQQQQARQEQQRRDMMQRMWAKLSGAGDPLDLVA